MITIGFLLYVISLKSSQIQSKRVKFSGGACPQTPLVLACFAYMCASHKIAMCVCIVSKSQEHVNYLGPGIKIGLVTPLLVCLALCTRVKLQESGKTNQIALFVITA